VQELLQGHVPGQPIDIPAVDQAFDEILAARNENHFAHYFSRLRIQFKGDELAYALEILRSMAETGSIDRVMMLDKAILLNLQERYRSIVEILVYDGYITNTGNPELYRFNSPVVRMWWLKYKCK